MLERKKLKSRSHGVSESRSFLVRYRRTYVLKNITNTCMVTVGKSFSLADNIFVEKYRFFFNID